MSDFDDDDSFFDDGEPLDDADDVFGGLACSGIYSPGTEECEWCSMQKECEKDLIG